MTSTGRVFVTLPFIAAGLALSSPSMARDAAPAFIPAGDVADAPSGFVEMCARNAVLCKAGIEAAAATPVAPTPAVAPTVAMIPVQVTPPSVDFDALLPRAISFRMACKSTAPRRTTFAGAFASLVFQPTFLSSFNNFGRALNFGPFGSNQQQNCDAGLGKGDYSAAALTLTPAISFTQTESAFAKPAMVQAEPRHSAGRLQLGAAEEFAFVKGINTQVNRAISPVADYITTGTSERWDRPGRGKYLVGDCEDFAIEKRMRLIEAGFAPDKLFYSAAYVKGYGMHIVLIARLQSGDMVLDSISPRMLPWTKVHYSWLRVQSTQNPMVWFRVGAPSTSSQFVNGATNRQAGAIS